MGPKFRGDEQDWLDSQDTQRGKALLKPKRKLAARSTGISIEETNARVSEVFPNQCRVKMNEDGQDFLCSYRRAEVIGKSKDPSVYRERTPVAVGDCVLVKKSDSSSGVIEGVAHRKNSLSRPAPGRESKLFHHVLAANIDLVAVVVAARNPLFSSGMVDRFLVASESTGIPALVCITKIDLLGNHPRDWNLYRELGYPIFEVSAHQKLGIEDLMTAVRRKTVVFCGPSGVGKTSLLRVILQNDQIGNIAEVNPHTGKGRHTTTGAVLLRGPDSSEWIDTPGVREFSLAHLSAEKVARYFPEMRSLKCAYSECQHLDEAGCCALELPRYPSYRRIIESILEE